MSYLTNMRPLVAEVKLDAYERDGRELGVGKVQHTWLKAHPERRDWVVFQIGDLSVTVDADQLARAVGAVTQ